VRACQVGWQGATTRVAASRKVEQRGQTAWQVCNQTRSGVAQLVSMIEGANACIHGTLRGLRSGQQRIQG